MDISTNKTSTMNLITTEKMFLMHEDSVKTNHSEFDELMEQNKRKAVQLIPVIVYIIILLAVGTIGNLLAIFIYGFKWHTSTTRVFLLWLAVIDLLNCLITMPTEIYIITNFYYFPEANFCRLSRFFTYVINNSSAAIFIVIAVDRYILICHPHKRTISVCGAQVACIVSLGVGLSVSWPALVLYGNKIIPVLTNTTKSAYINGIICEVKSEMDKTPYPNAYFIYLWCAFLVCFLIITILYTLIGRVMLSRIKRRSSRPRSEPSFYEANSFNEYIGMSFHNGKGASGRRKAKLKFKKRRISSSLSYNNSTSSKVFNSECHTTRRPNSTLILFAISAVFVLSFLPFLVIMTLRQHVGPRFYPSLSPSNQVAVNIFARSYLVNNCANPIVYGLFNSQFRDKLKKQFHMSFKRPKPASSVLESRSVAEGP